jgi:hypothetical protein
MFLGSESVYLLAVSPVTGYMGAVVIKARHFAEGCWKKCRRKLCSFDFEL